MNYKEKFNNSICYLDNENLSKPCLVFIHGNSGSKEVFMPQLEFFSFDFHCYALDLPGQGKSKHVDCKNNDGAYTIDYYGSFIAKFISDHKINNPTIIAHSLGGHLAIDACSKITSQVKSLILINTSPLETMSDLADAFAPLEEVGALFKADVEDNEVKNLFKLLSHNIEPKSLIETFKKADPNFRSNLALGIHTSGDPKEITKLNSYKGASFVLFSKNEKIFNKEYLDKLKSRLDQSQVINLSIEGHFPNLEEPKEFNEQIRSLLGSIKPE